MEEDEFSKRTFTPTSTNVADIACSTTSCTSVVHNHKETYIQYVHVCIMHTYESAKIATPRTNSLNIPTHVFHGVLLFEHTHQTSAEK